MINIALPKGRLLHEIIAVFKKAGIVFDGLSTEHSSRKLFFECPKHNLRCFLAKPFDVPAYVEKGSADIGICGNDIIIERNADVFELADLHTGECFMAVARKNDFREDKSRPLRAGTEYPRITQEYYAQKGRDTEIIMLRGSAELALVSGTADVIVDIVQSGKTLSDNNLSEDTKIFMVSARLICNKSAYYFMNDEIIMLSRRLKNVTYIKV